MLDWIVCFGVRANSPHQKLCEFLGDLTNGYAGRQARVYGEHAFVFARDVSPNEAVLVTVLPCPMTFAPPWPESATGGREPADIIKPPALPLALMPAFHPLHAGRHIVPQLVDPEPHDIPPQFDETHVAKLVPPEKFAVPVPVITFPIDLDVQLSPLREQSEVQQEFLLGELGNRAQSRIP
jgi:hypothetical protein